MSVRFALKNGGVKSAENPRSITFEYVLTGITDYNYARAYACSATYPTVNGLYRQDVQLESQGYNVWYVTVPYGVTRAEPSETEFVWSFDTTGGTARITHAKEHIASYAPPGMTAPNHYGAIGVNQDGEVEGCEIVVPAFKWTERWQLPWASYSWAYANFVKLVTGRTNAATFRGRAPGTVRFNGATGSQSSRNPEILDCTFHFEEGSAAEGVTVGPITGVNKGAWEVAWVEYHIEEDATAKRRATRPIAVHVERVLDSADFALLGIGS